MSDFRFLTSLRVYWRDVDMLGHVNNAVYASYLEAARIDFNEAAIGEEGFRRWSYLIGELRMRYVSPAYLRETLEIGIRLPSIGRRSFRFEYLVREATTGRVVVEAESTQVMVDLATGKSRDIPDDFRSAIEAFQGGPVEDTRGV